MPPELYNLDAALRALERGDLDSLSPEQVARLEEALNAEPAAAAWVGDLQPPRDEPLAKLLRQTEEPALPAAAEWERVWERVAAERTGEKARRRVGRIIRLWQPLAAIAAGLVLVVAWRVGSAPREADWPVEIGGAYEIHDLEVGEGAVPFVFATGGEQRAEVIWVLELDQES